MNLKPRSPRRASVPLPLACKPSAKQGSAKGIGNGLQTAEKCQNRRLFSPFNSARSHFCLTAQSSRHPYIKGSTAPAGWGRQQRAAGGFPYTKPGARPAGAAPRPRTFPGANPQLCPGPPSSSDPPSPAAHLLAQQRQRVLGLRVPQGAGAARPPARPPQQQQQQGRGSHHGHGHGHRSLLRGEGEELRERPHTHPPHPLSTTPASPLPPAPPWQQLPAALGLLARLGSALPCPQPGPQCQPLGRPPPRSILLPGCDRHGPSQSPLRPHQDCRYRVATPVTQAEAVLIGFVSAAGLCHTHRPWSALQKTNKETIRAGQGARAGQATRAGQEIRERGQEG